MITRVIQLVCIGLFFLSASICADTLRIASTNGSGISSIDATASVIIWTNSHAGAFDLEHAADPNTEWLPLTYGIASQSVEMTQFPTDRSYRLGFTPFPYGLGSNANETLTVMSNVYGFIEANADIVSHHFDAGVPWPEALDHLPFSTNMENDLLFRKFMTPTSHTVFLSMTPIDIGRTMMSPYRGEQEDMPLPAPWDTYAFDHTNVMNAYYFYCKRMIDFFEPEYASIGIEVNLLMDLSPHLWPAYFTLHTSTYARLKTDFPTLPIAVSWTGMDLVDGYTDAIHTQQLAAVNMMTNHIDYYGLSMHTFISALTAETVIPVALIRAIAGLVDKPLAICETGYPAQPFDLLGGTLVFNGSEEKQAQFFKNLFTALDDFDLRFVINFVPIDYDQLWNEIGQPDDINKVWRDTGLLDETLSPREALRVWRGRLALQVR